MAIEQDTLNHINRNMILVLEDIARNRTITAEDKILLSIKRLQKTIGYYRKLMKELG